MAKTSYKGDPAPRVVSSGTVSRPKSLPKWRPKLDAANATPRIVRATGSSANG